MDVKDVTSSQLRQADACDRDQWIVIAGPECQDFSPAGFGRGLQGRHGTTLQVCVDMLGNLQQRAIPPLFM